MPEPTTYTPIALDYPHDVAVIFQNPSNSPLIVPCLGKKGLTFRPHEIIAVIGNPLVYPGNPQRYDGMKDVVSLHRLIHTQQLLVLSTPTDKHTDVLVGSEYPNTRIFVY